MSESTLANYVNNPDADVSELSEEQQVAILDAQNNLGNRVYEGTGANSDLLFASPQQ